MNNDIERIQSELLKYRASLYDRASGLPTVNAIFDDLRKILEQEKTIGILYLAIGDQSRIEPVFGWEIYDELVKIFTICVLGEVGKLIPGSALVAISSVMGDGFFIFINRTKSGGMVNKDYLRNLSDEFSEKMKKIREELKFKEIKDRIDIHTSYQIFRVDPMVRIERFIYQAIEDLKYAAYFKEKLMEKDLYAELQRLIRNKDITTVFQPIYNLQDNSVYGYEALTRGPKGSFFEDPDTIFSFAAKYELLSAMEELCLYNAIKSASKLNSNGLIFLNITPDQIPKLLDNHFENNLSEFKLNNNRIVIEMTEKFAIPHYGIYQEIIVRTKGKGLKIALDDVGVGYSTLERISEISPDYLKYDRTLVRDIDKNLIRQELIKSFVNFAQRIDAIIIAEGIENKNELDFIKNLGITYGQGFYLCKPKSVEELRK
ncbi:MAG: EAL domain-containing protein [bacterium]